MMRYVMNNVAANHKTECDERLRHERVPLWVGVRGLMGAFLFSAMTGCLQAQSPAKPQVPPGDHELSLKVGELERRYIVHVPSGYDGKKAMPVVIMFHGGGGTARGAMRETSWAQKADREGFLAVFPEAMPPDSDKPSRFGTNGQSWNDGSGRFHSGERDIADIAFVGAMLDDLESRFMVDKRRVYATGFSNGAAMTFRVGAELPGRVVAVAPFAGSMWVKPMKSNQPVSIYVISGDADPLNPLEGGLPKFATGTPVRTGTPRSKPPLRDAVAAWAAAFDCNAESRQMSAPPGVTTLVHDGGRDGVEVRFTVIQGHGHIWPGGRNQLPERMVGKASDAFNATDAIWEFFREHARRVGN